MLALLVGQLSILIDRSASVHGIAQAPTAGSGWCTVAGAAHLVSGKHNPPSGALVARPVKKLAPARGASKLADREEHRVWRGGGDLDHIGAGPHV